VKRRFIVILESAGDGADPEGWQGFRRWLKHAWRQYALKVIDMTTTPPLPRIGEPSQPPAAQPRKDAL
jgi:hypothetical protein